MERAQYLISRNRTSSFYSYVKGDFLLPVSATQNSEKPPRLRVRALLGHCLYRRVVIWTVTVLLLLSLTVFKTATTTRVRSFARLTHLTVAAENDEDRPRVFGDQADGNGGGNEGLPWMKFELLKGYFHGVKSIVPLSEHTPEYPPNIDGTPPPSASTAPLHHAHPPKQSP